MTEKKYKVVLVSPERHMELKKKAAAEGMSVSSLVEALLGIGLKNHAEKPAR